MFQYYIKSKQLEYKGNKKDLVFSVYEFLE